MHLSPSVPLLQSTSTSPDKLSTQPTFDHNNIRVGQPPFIEGAADANMPGGIFECMAQTGVSIEINGTCVGPLSKRQPTGVDHTTDAESSAVCTAGKLCRYIRTFMVDTEERYWGSNRIHARRSPSLPVLAIFFSAACVAREIFENDQQIC